MARRINCGERRRRTLRLWVVAVLASALLAGLSPTRDAAQAEDLPPLLRPAADGIVGGGGLHTCGVRSDGAVECWGFNELHQTDSPGGTFLQVAVAFGHSCGLRPDGTIQCWGQFTPMGNDPLPRTFIQMSATDDSFCAVRVSSNPTSWGAAA